MTSTDKIRLHDTNTLPFLVRLLLLYNIHSGEKNRQKSYMEDFKRFSLVCISVRKLPEVSEVIFFYQKKLIGRAANLKSSPTASPCKHRLLITSGS